MPKKVAAEPFVGIVNTVFKLRDRRLEANAALKIQALNNNEAIALFVPEKTVGCCRDYALIVLCHDVGDDRHVRAIVKGDSVLAVMDVEIVRNDVLAENEAVLKALAGNVP